MIRLLLAVWLGKVISFLTTCMKKGGGSAAPGYQALKLCPNLVSVFSKQIPQSVIITGTNGKTTTSRMLDQFARAQGLKVLRNQTGSNMERGVASTLIKAASPLTLRLPKVDLAIWEIDEATFKLVVNKIKPDIIVFLNAARDQLDRYGELDSLVREWRDALSGLKCHPLILINNDDASTRSLSAIKGLTFKTFGTDKKIVEWEKEAPRGKKPDVEASAIVEKSDQGLFFDLQVGKDKISISFPINGSYHVYDILASAGAAHFLDIPLTQAKEVLKSYLPAFGRVEKINYQEKEIIITLIKNPNGATQVFKTLTKDFQKGDQILIALNDNIADGKDVSWIWDANFEELTQVKGSPIICSGTRAEDLALRLKYAGIPEEDLTLENNLTKAIQQALTQTQSRLFILPTYTALLALQNIFTSMGIKHAYWKEEN